MKINPLVKITELWLNDVLVLDINAMEKILFKVIMKELPDENEIINALRNICDDVHASCNEDCPVYSLNRGPLNPKIWGPLNPKASDKGCEAFKSGRRMLEFIRTKLLIKKF